MRDIIPQNSSVQRVVLSMGVIMSAFRDLLRVGAAVFLAACVTSACSVAHVEPEPRAEPAAGSKKSRGHGPPPHAPAHGHRAKTSHGVEIVFDAKLEVYILVGYSDYYYHGEHYYRVHDDGWQVSVQVAGSWEAVEEEKLPPGLRGKDKDEDKGKGRGKGKGKNKDKGGG